jgi:hypothetical protein
MNGTYHFVYSGPTGVGLGIFRITDNQLVGTDLGGVRYRGTAIANSDGTIRLSIEQTVPPGVFLAQGVSAQEVPITRSFSFTAPPDFGDGAPIKADTPPSPVWLMIRRVPDDNGAFADGIIVDIRSIATPAMTYRAQTIHP